MHKPEKLLGAMFLSYCSWVGRLLADTAVDTLKLLCPPALQLWVQEHEAEFKSSPPSASYISRLRLPFDASWNLVWQEEIAEVLEEEPNTFVTLMADSTPMFGLEWVPSSVRSGKRRQAGGNVGRLFMPCNAG